MNVTANSLDTENNITQCYASFRPFRVAITISGSRKFGSIVIGQAFLGIVKEIASIVKWKVYHKWPRQTGIK